MLGIFLAIFGLIVILVIFIEYRNEKKYQEERREKREKTVQPKRRPQLKKVIRKPSPSIQQETPQEEFEEEILKKETPKKQLPHCNYPKFSHVRLIDMGLSDEESKEFVAELIPQIETQIPLIKEAMDNSDFHQMERLTHNIKESATNTLKLLIF